MEVVSRIKNVGEACIMSQDDRKANEESDQRAKRESTEIHKEKSVLGSKVCIGNIPLR